MHMVDMRFLSLIAVLVLSACATFMPPIDPLALAKQRYETNPQSSHAMRHYGQILLDRDNAAKGLEVIAPLLEADVPALADMYLKASLLSALRDDPEAPAPEIEALYKQILARDKLYVDARIDLAALHDQLGLHEKAYILYREILDTPSRSALRRNDYFRLVDGFILHLVETESFEEAFIFLTEAKDEYGALRDLERNHRIVRALMQSHGHSAPKPLPKPLPKPKTNETVFIDEIS